VAGTSRVDLQVKPSMSSVAESFDHEEDGDNVANTEPKPWISNF